MRSRRITLLCIAVLMSLMAVTAPPARGEALAAKSVQMIIGFGPGGGYDLWGRTVARHIGRHLPGNPAVIAQNMPGAGSYTAASYIFNIAPKDGTVLGIIARDAALGPLSGAPGARFDATKLSWIGTPTKETNVCIAYHTAQVQSVADLFEKQLIVGDTGPGTGTRSYPKALNELIGTKFKLVGGFPASSDVFLAMERGEVEGICESLDSIRIGGPIGFQQRRFRFSFKAAQSPTPSFRAFPSCSSSGALQNSGKQSNFSMPAKGSGAPSSRRRICRRSG
jgi:tripartite-type tricarboxylate transporter receptor subunit TctC